MSNEMSFSHHTEQAANKGKVMSGWILRIFQTEQKLPLWKLIPRLAYQCHVWNPSHYKRHDIIRTGSKSSHLKIRQHGRLQILGKTKTSQAFLYKNRESYLIMYIWKIMENLAPNPREEGGGGIKTRHFPWLGRTCHHLG